MILGIDTSLGTAVAVVEADGVVRAQASSDNPLGHAEVIGALLQTVLAGAAHEPGSAGSADVELTHVAVGMGPGPFTGLRVGIAAARAFALGRALPVVPVPSHDAAALQILIGQALADPFEEAPRFAVVTDARRREYAYSIYDGIDDDGIPVRMGGAALVSRDGIDEVLAAAAAVRREVTAVSGAMVATLAARALAARRSLAGTEPLYLRAPDVTLPAPRHPAAAAAAAPGAMPGSPNPDRVRGEQGTRR